MKFSFVPLAIFLVLLLSCQKDDVEGELEIVNDVNIVDDSSSIEETTVDFLSEEYLVISQTLDLPETLYDYTVDLPNYFFDDDVEDEDNTPNNNPVTDVGATLGRVLFYDKRLSANNTISCASCHLQENGFSDPERFSIGFEGGLTPRNSMGLANARFYENGRFFWDERANSLEDQVLQPIQDEVEMGLTLDEMENKLAQDECYAILFSKAFGDANITSERVSLALAQVVRSMVSYESKFDEGLALTNNPETSFPNFTPSENIGRALFFSNRTQCSNCHTSNAFVGDAARNNGLDLVLTDLGVGGITGNNNDRGEFKVNSLKNIALTAPYMHDGRFATLREVVEHYNNGVQDSPELDNRLRVQGGNVRRLNLTENEIQGLVDFLETLTDENFIADEKFSDPFIN